VTYLRVKIDGKMKDFRTIWMENSVVKMIDQTKLPYKFEIFTSKDHHETARAIKNMVVRGAPAIGAAGAYGTVQATIEATKTSSFDKTLKKYVNELKNTRPTAVDLFHAIDRVLDQVRNGTTNGEWIELARNEADEIVRESVYACKRIGEYGNKLIKNGYKILTHCNAGWLACVDWGTALAPIYVAHRSGKDVFVFVDETRPRLQGAKLTAWELEQECIPYAIIADNAAGYYMQKREIDMVIVGADRVTVDGSVTNKIGTYEKAVVAKENGIPFYVAVPMSTLDFDITRDEIKIEERSGNEVLYVYGINHREKFNEVRIAPSKSKALNPAFDITPSEFITSFITEKGIFKPNELKKLKRKKSEMISTC